MELQKYLNLTHMLQILRKTMFEMKRGTRRVSLFELDGRETPTLFAYTWYYGHVALMKTSSDDF